MEESGREATFSSSDEGGKVDFPLLPLPNKLRMLRAADFPTPTTNTGELLQLYNAALVQTAEEEVTAPHASRGKEHLPFRVVVIRPAVRQLDLGYVRTLSEIRRITVGGTEEENAGGEMDLRARK